MNYRKLTVEESLVNTSADDCKITLDDYERRLDPEKLITLCTRVLVYMDKRGLHEGYTTKRRYLHAARKRALKRLDARGKGMT